MFINISLIPLFYFYDKKLRVEMVIKSSDKINCTNLYKI